MHEKHRGGPRTSAHCRESQTSRRSEENDRIEMVVEPGKYTGCVDFGWYGL